MGHVVVERDTCKGCGLCIAFCSKDVLRLSSELNQLGYHPVEMTCAVESGECTGCARCALMCPDAAITVYR